MVGGGRLVTTRWCWLSVTALTSTLRSFHSTPPPVQQSERARAREGVRDISYNDGRILGQDIM